MSRLSEIASKIFKTKTPDRSKTPDISVYRNYSGRDVYLSDYLVDCVVFGANQISKGRIKSVVATASKTEVVNDSITRLFRYKPNPEQTTADFLKCAWNVYEIKGDLFIYPQYELVETVSGNAIKKIKSFRIVPYSDFEIDTLSDTIKFTLVSYLYGEQKTVYLPYSDVIHMKNRRAGINPLCGGDTQGRMDYTGIQPVVSALSELINGIKKAIKNFGILGIYRADSSANEARMTEIMKTFEERIGRSDYGFLYSNLEGTFDQLRSEMAQIDPKMLEYLDSFCARRFGVSLAMLSGDYTYAQYAAFHSTAIEPFINELEQAFSAVLYTQREQDLGHMVKFYDSLVEHYSTEHKIKLFSAGTNTGLITVNEGRAMFGWEPVEGGDVRIMSLAYIDAKNAAKYQVGGKIKTVKIDDDELIEDDEKEGEEDDKE